MTTVTRLPTAPAEQRNFAWEVEAVLRMVAIALDPDS